jgi:hypothetical protein
VAEKKSLPFTPETKYLTVVHIDHHPEDPAVERNLDFLPGKIYPNPFNLTQFDRVSLNLLPSSRITRNNLHTSFF